MDLVVDCKSGENKCLKYHPGHLILQYLRTIILKMLRRDMPKEQSTKETTGLLTKKAVDKSSSYERSTNVSCWYAYGSYRAFRKIKNATV